MTDLATVLDHISALLAQGQAPSTASERTEGERPESIIYVTGVFAYNSLGALLSMIARHWQEAGLRLVELDIRAPDWSDRLTSIIATTRVRFCISIGGLALEILRKAPRSWELMRFPVVCLHCDHPAYYGSRHHGLPPNVVLAYMFRDHALYQSEHVKSANIVSSIDFGVPDLPVADQPEKDSGATPSIVFAKTGHDPRELEVRWRAQPRLDRIIHDALDQVGLLSCGAYPAAVQRAAAAHRIELQPFDKLTRFLIAQIDDYVRRRKSTAIANAIKTFPVDIYGDHWEHIEREGARARFLGGTDYQVVSQAIVQATASITMNPNVELSAHDRFFTALGAGAMPVSDTNSFIAANFPSLVPFTFRFEKGELESVLDRIYSRPSDARDLARSVRSDVITRIPTRHAAEQIWTCVDLVHYFEYSFVAPQPFFAV